MIRPGAPLPTAWIHPPNAVTAAKQPARGPCRTDRPAQMIVDYSTTESFQQVHRVRGPAALPVTDFTSKVELTGLPAGERIFFRIKYWDLAQPKITSDWAMGSFQTAPRSNADVFFAWSGDTAGQGFGINPDWGGMKIYEAIRELEPQFFIHSGDYIYADNPIPSEIELDDGTIWKNIVTQSKSKVAETLDEFRGNYTYNLLDENVRRFNASVAQYLGRRLRVRPGSASGSA